MFSRHRGGRRTDYERPHVVAECLIIKDFGKHTYINHLYVDRLTKGFHTYAYIQYLHYSALLNLCSYEIYMN